MADAGWSPKIPTKKIRGKHLAIGLFVVMGLTLITFAAIIGRGQGDEGCQCTSPDQAGWNWASAVILILSVAILAILLWDPSLLVTSF